MTKTIGDYTAANSIDATNDYLLIEPSGNTVYKKINRNTLLSLSSAPLGTTDSQSPTNKTFDNTNQLTLKDTKFTLQDDGDVTKQIAFQLSGLTTSTTRTLTVPDASGTLVLTGATQTLTAKTLTSPTISGGTIDNSTITVDSIAGHSSATVVTVANLQISNGVLNTSNAVTATSIADGAIQPKALVTGTGSGWAWSTWSPTWTNLNLGNGVLNAKYIQIGKAVFGQVNLLFGSTTTVSGGVKFTLPVTSNSAYRTDSVIGTLIYNGVVYGPGFLCWTSTTTATLQATTVSATYATGVDFSSTVPFTWGTGSALTFNFNYEAA